MTERRLNMLVNADHLTAEAVVFEAPQHVDLRELSLIPPESTDIVVDICASGVSTGTERLLWQGTMPAFPGLGYPLVPGYESVGRVVNAGEQSGRSEGDFVFVPGAQCFGGVRGLFGGAASRLVVPAKRAFNVNPTLGDKALLLALAATAHHALNVDYPQPRLSPDLIIGHGVVGRLIARLSLALGNPAPVVWETNPRRHDGASGYAVMHPDDDERNDYRCVIDVSGDSRILDSAIARLVSRTADVPAPVVVLAGFYKDALSFQFAPAFMRQVRIQVAAEWQPQDIDAVHHLAERGLLSLDGLITHRSPTHSVRDAYETAFNDDTCLKMVLEWRGLQ